MIFLKNTNKLFLLISSIILIYIIFLLLSNISNGFDITDESYYILMAQHPNDMFSTLRHEGYYTGLLFFLSGHNLSYFRLLGILLLIFISILFAIELYKYISKKFDFTVDIWDKLLFVVSVSIGSLSYYRSWLITPSYNWLALVSVILVLTSLLKVISNKELNYDRYITLDYILLSFSLSLAFMAKPTTALGLVIISILFVIYEFKNINLKKALPTVIISTSIIVAAHIIILDGGFSSYYNRLIEGAERFEVVSSAYTLGSRYSDTIQLIKLYFFESFYFHKINDIYIYGTMFIVAILFIIRNKINSLNIYIAFMFVILIVYSYNIYEYSLAQNFKLIWIRSIEVLLLNFILVITTSLFINKKIEFLYQIIKIIPLLFIIILGSFAYKFGSDNQIILAISSSMIFVIASIVALNYMLDKRLNIKIFTALMGLIMSIFIYFQINNAYEHPYRLITNIKGQNQKIELLGGLEVDRKTKQYIVDLQKITTNSRGNGEKISLIDMTGGSPGANVILNADFFDDGWLYGGYTGSNPYALRNLKTYQDTDKLKKAWILTAPKGKRKLDLNILNKIGLNFPSGYKKIGVVKTAHRNEVQELWKPK